MAGEYERLWKQVEKELKKWRKKGKGDGEDRARNEVWGEI